jgi:phospholipid/cholesterol/gamma-HCH transport system substrate-binding protein
MELALRPGASTVSLSAGDSITVYSAPGLNDLAGTLGDRASEILDQTRRLLSDQLIDDVHSATGSVSESMAHIKSLLDEEVEALETLIEGLSTTSSQLADATSGPELDRTIANIDTLTTRLASASDDLDASSASLSSILEKIDRGDGSLGKMVNDPDLYDRLTAATENVQAATEEIALLTKDVRERPERYLKGVKFSVF